MAGNRMPVVVAALVAVVVLVGVWILAGGAQTDDPPTPALELRPELIGSGTAMGASPELVADGRPVSVADGAVAQPPAPMLGWQGAGAPSPARDQARPDLVFNLLLDRVFAPERMGSAVPAIAAGAAPERSDGDEVSGAGQAVARGGRSVPGDAAASVDPGAAPSRQAVTEREYHEAFLALGREDPEALARQADAALGGSVNSQQVAVLRALYETDKARAAVYFLRAITTLPDRSQPSGVSVPAFALAFLCKRASDPDLRRTLEQVAVGANVPEALRRQALNGLIESASPEERMRYASYPGFADIVGDGVVR